MTVVLTQELSLRNLANVCELRKTLQESTSVVATLQRPDQQPWFTRSNGSDRRIEFGRRAEEVKLQKQRWVEQVKFCLLRWNKTKMSRAGFW